MEYLLAVPKDYFNAMCAFVAIMCVIGFVLIMIDKKRWKEQERRSDEMMRPKKKTEADATDGEDGSDKKKKKKQDVPFEYKDRIPDKAIFAVATLFGAIGVLLGMIVFRHKWYKSNYRLYIPIITLVNVVLIAVVLFFLYTNAGDTTVSYTN